jgi:DtxR family manganese transport transcriptional regulator
MESGDGQALAAQRHERVRRQHSDELAQDYVEAIWKGGEGLRVKDLQAVFGVSHVTVVRMLRRMEGQGLVTYARRQGVHLTDSGRALAQAAAERHALLVRFFSALGVSPEQADADAEGAEHHLSRETYAAIARFLGEAQG